MEKRKILQWIMLLQWIMSGVVIIGLGIHSVGLNIELQNNIDKTKYIIEKCSMSIDNLSEVLDYQQETIWNLSSLNEELLLELEVLKEMYSIEKQNKLNIENKFKQIEEDYNNIKSQKGLINPTYRELKNFVRKDDTDELDYDDNFDCTEFSNKFIKNFAEEGYYSCTAEIDLIYDIDEEGAHIIIAIFTIDKGLIYVEPQDNIIINSINIGEDYCDIVDWNCNWEITKISSCFELKL